MNRKFLASMAGDGDSHRGFRARDSIWSEVSDRLSKLSREFEFDGTLLSTRTYSSQSVSLIVLLRQRLKKDSSGHSDTRIADGEPGASANCSVEELQLQRELESNPGRIPFGTRLGGATCGNRLRVAITGTHTLPLEMVHEYWDFDGRFGSDAVATAAKSCISLSPTTANGLDMASWTSHCIHFMKPCIQIMEGDWPPAWALVGTDALPSAGFFPRYVIYIVDLVHHEGDLADLMLQVATHLEGSMTSPWPVARLTCLILAEDKKSNMAVQMRDFCRVFGSQSQRRNLKALIVSWEEFCANPYYLVRFKFPSMPRYM